MPSGSFVLLLATETKKQNIHITRTTVKPHKSSVNQNSKNVNTIFDIIYRISKYTDRQ